MVHAHLQTPSFLSFFFRLNQVRRSHAKDLREGGMVYTELAREYGLPHASGSASHQPVYGHTFKKNFVLAQVWFETNSVHIANWVSLCLFSCAETRMASMFS